MKDQFIFFHHGGDTYGKDVMHDLSVSLNPMGPPDFIKDIVTDAWKEIGRYPDILCRDLRVSLSRCYRIPEDRIVCGCGVSELLTALGRMYAGRKILIPVPSYVGYERAFFESDISFPLMDEGDDLSAESILDELCESSYDALVMGDPSNPTGRLMRDDTLYELLDSNEKKGSLLILDESFAEITDGYDEKKIGKLLERYPCLISLRSVTKSYAIPGIRLGYALCGDPDMASRLSMYISEWSVSPFASKAGCAIFDDPGRSEYLDKSRELIRSLREDAEVYFQEKGIRYIKSGSCFMLFYSDRYMPSENSGILIRDCSDIRGLGRGWYRTSFDRENTIITGKVVL